MMSGNVGKIDVEKMSARVRVWVYVCVRACTHRFFFSFFFVYIVCIVCMFVLYVCMYNESFVIRELDNSYKFQAIKLKLLLQL